MTSLLEDWNAILKVCRKAWALVNNEDTKNNWNS